MPTLSPQLSIILPTYNEEGNIIPLVRDIIVTLKSSSFEILIIDDNSPDGTAEKAKKEFHHDKRIRIFVKKKDKGLARAIMYGIQKSKGVYILVMDTDFNHNPNDIPRFLRLKGKYDLIVGSRYIPGGGMENRMRYYASFLYNLIIRFILSLPTKDSLSGFFLIKRSLLEKINFQTTFIGYGDYFMRLIKHVHQHTKSICEVPVFYKNRFSGESKSKLIIMCFNYSRTVFNLLTSL